MQYSTTHNEEGPVLHLTLAIPGMTTTFHLPGTTSVQLTEEPDIDMGAIITQHARAQFIKPAVKKVYRRRQLKLNENRATQQDKSGIFTTPTAEQKGKKKRKLDTPISEETVRRSLRKIRDNNGYKAQPQMPSALHPMTRSRVKALATQKAVVKARKLRHSLNSCSKLTLPNLVSDVEFPGLSDIINNDNQPYPPISISEL